MNCKDCGSEFFSTRIIGNDKCPVCGGEGTGEIHYYDFTDNSYGINFEEFVSVLKSDKIYSEIRKAVSEWLECKISYNQEGVPLLQHRGGLYINLLAAHLKIQLNKEWQQSIYNRCMGIWR